MAEATRVFVEDVPAAAPNVDVRPKLLKRPSQFSNTAPTASPSLVVPPIVAEPAKSAPTQMISTLPARAIAWQDDGRFGVIACALVVAFNFALAFTLPLLPRLHHTTDSHSQGMAFFGDSALPQPVANSGPSVITTYADPASGNRLATDFDLKNYQNGANGLSVSPSDIPPPRAKAMPEKTP